MPRVLVVDDDPDVSELMRLVLTAAGHSVVLRCNGDDGMAALRAQRFDAVVVDWVMPGMNGLEMLRACRDDDSLRAVPIVMLTARAFDDEAVCGLEAGATAYVTKPFSPRKLTALIAKLLVDAA